MRTVNCLECDRPIYPHNWTVPPRFRNHGRGLCGRCYHSLARRGYLNDCPRATHPASQLAKQWLDMKDRGWTRREAAAHLGVTLAALEQAITRHNRATRTRAVSLSA